MSNLPVTSATSLTSGILNNSLRTLSLSLESILMPVSALTPNPKASSLITIVNSLIRPLFTSLFILLYTTEALTLIFLESLGTEILASWASSLKILRSNSSILPIWFSDYIFSLVVNKCINFKFKRIFLIIITGDQSIALCLNNSASKTAPLAEPIFSLWENNMYFMPFSKAVSFLILPITVVIPSFTSLSSRG